MITKKLRSATHQHTITQVTRWRNQRTMFNKKCRSSIFHPQITSNSRVLRNNLNNSRSSISSAWALAAQQSNQLPRKPSRWPHNSTESRQHLKRLLLFLNHNLSSRRFRWLSSWNSSRTHKTCMHRSHLSLNLHLKNSMTTVPLTTMTWSWHKTSMTSRTQSSMMMKTQKSCKQRRTCSITTLNAWSKKLIWSQSKEKSLRNLRMQCWTMKLTIWTVTSSRQRKSPGRNSRCTQSFYRTSSHSRRTLWTDKITELEGETRLDL